MTDNTRTQALADLQRLGQEHDAAGGWTPGPWKTLRWVADGDDVFLVGPANGAVCQMVMRSKWQKDCAGDNANLIAAAPDLAEALQMLVASVSSSDEIGNADLHEAVEAARAALAKARGDRG